MATDLYCRIMENGTTGWYWEIVTKTRDVLARGLADTHAAARAKRRKWCAEAARRPVFGKPRKPSIILTKSAISQSRVKAPPTSSTVRFGAPSAQGEITIRTCGAEKVFHLAGNDPEAIVLDFRAAMTRLMGQRG